MRQKWNNFLNEIFMDMFEAGGLNLRSGEVSIAVDLDRHLLFALRHTVFRAWRIELMIGFEWNGL